MADVNKTVQINIKGDSSKLNKSLQGAQAGFAKLAKGVAVAGAAIAGVTAGIFKLNQAVADMINELADASAKSGIAVDNLSALKLAAEGSGRSFADIESGLIRFQQSMSRAAEGTGRQAEAFQQLGVQVRDTDGSMRSSNSVFEDTIQKLSQMEQGTDRNVAILDLFGRSAGAALIQSGAIDAFDQYLERVEKFGLDVGPKAREEAAKWQRAVADMKMVTERALQDIVSGLTGGMSLSKALTEATGVFIFMKSVASDVFNAIKGTLTAVIGNITAFVAALGQINFEKISRAVTLLANPITMVEGLKQARIIGEELRTTSLELNKENTAFAEQALTNVGNFLSRAQAARKEFVAGANIAGTGFQGGGPGGRRDQEKKAAAAREKEAIRLAELQKEIDAIMDKNNEKTITASQKIKNEYQEQINRLQEIQELSKNQLDTTEQQRQLEIARELELTELRKTHIQQLKEMEADAIAEIQEKEAAQLQQRISNINTYGKAVTSYFSSFGAAVATTMQNSGKMTEEQAAKMHRLQQAAGIADVLINQSVAIMKAYAMFGPVGGLAASAALSALGVAQIAAISSQPPPKFHTGGMVDGADVVNAQLLRGEAVLDRQTVRRIGGADGVQNIGKQPQVVVMNSFKHFDRYLASSLRGNTRLKRLAPANTGRRF